MIKLLCGFSVVLLVGCNSVDQELNTVITPIKESCSVDKNNNDAYIACLTNEMHTTSFFDSGTRVAIANEIQRLQSDSEV